MDPRLGPIRGLLNNDSIADADDVWSVWLALRNSVSRRAWLLSVLVSAKGDVYFAHECFPPFTIG